MQKKILSHKAKLDPAVLAEIVSALLLNLVFLAYLEDNGSNPGSAFVRFMKMFRISGGRGKSAVFGA